MRDDRTPIVDIQLRPIVPAHYRAVHAFQCEYLDTESYDEFMTRVESADGLYFTAFHGAELVGVCYGQPSLKDESAMQLQGIAVNLDETKPYARKGIGSALLSQFAKEAISRGFASIDVGSADDEKVERFYLRNGFTPYELVAKTSDHHELERVSVADYETGKVSKEVLRNKHGAKEVIFIFRKPL